MQSQHFWDIMDHPSHVSGTRWITKLKFCWKKLKLKDLPSKQWLWRFIFLPLIDVLCHKSVIRCKKSTGRACAIVCLVVGTVKEVRVANKIGLSQSTSICIALVGCQWQWKRNISILIEKLPSCAMHDNHHRAQEVLFFPPCMIWSSRTGLLWPNCTAQNFFFFFFEAKSGMGFYCWFQASVSINEIHHLERIILCTLSTVYDFFPAQIRCFASLNIF